MPLHAEGMKSRVRFWTACFPARWNHRCRADRFGRPAHCAGAAVPFELRRRSNAVRRRRGAYPRNVTGTHSNIGTVFFAVGLPHDDLRRCAWVNGVNAILNALLFSALTAPFHRAKVSLF